MSHGPEMPTTPSTIEVTMDNGSKVVFPFDGVIWERLVKGVGVDSGWSTMNVKHQGYPHSLIVLRKVSSARVIW